MIGRTNSVYKAFDRPGIIIRLRLIILVVACLSANRNFVFAQKATITEKKETFRTYPYGDPNPIPLVNNIYPYFRFDGYTDKPRDKEWSVITLENPYIKVLIAPEIGGKVLGAFEKSTGLPFIYFNKVIKFRDIAMRGPWTSGGIEFNFGDIGHAPSTAAPVDYLTRENADGSVSCFIGATDLASRTEWRVEIRLDKDKSYFETNSFWYNPTNLNTSLYNWSNAAASVGEDLKYYFPGGNFIGHDGSPSPWPVAENGRDVSFYKNNDYGEYHSYHVLGTYTDYFGGIWGKSNFGFGHWSPYPEKPGKKIWIWALSPQGQIWESLLTDTALGNRQYTEIQSGLLFNQAASSSSLTPFKHSFFTPQADQRFTERWFPVKGLGGIADANSYGTLDVKSNDDRIVFGICANQDINDDLKVSVNGKKVYTKRICLKPSAVFIDSVSTGESGKTEVMLGDNLLRYDSGENKGLSRPLEANKEFDWNSLEGIYTQGNERAKQRDNSVALAKYMQCLEKSPAFTPALVGAAEILFSRAEYTKALDCAMKALSNDAYDPDANFIYGTISKKLNKLYDAKDGFGAAARSMKYRSAANEQLAEICFLEQKYRQADEYADLSIDYNKYNLDAYKILAVARRAQQDYPRASSVLDKLLAIDPLSHFARFEKYLSDGKTESLVQFTSLIRNEFPQETYLELAAYYASLNLTDDAIAVLRNAPSHPVVYYWLAYLNSKTNRVEESLAFMEKALEGSPYLVFPHRQETAEVLSWADQLKNSWKTKYYLGLMRWHTGRIEEARNYFSKCGNIPDYAPFYLTRASLNKTGDSAEIVADYNKAISLKPEEWRSYHLLTSFFIERGDYVNALRVSKDAAERFRTSYIMVFDYARSLLYNDQYEKCLSILDTLKILPFEGAGYGHIVYREACNLLGLSKYKTGEFTSAIALTEKAKTWPENLGAGAPYDVDTRIEDYIASACFKNMGDNANAEKRLSAVLKYTSEHPDRYNSKLLIGAFAMMESKTRENPGGLLQKWLSVSPDDMAARWSLARFNKGAESAQKEFHKARKQWYPVTGDPDFKLVYELVNTLKK